MEKCLLYNILCQGSVLLLLSLLLVVGVFITAINMYYHAQLFIIWINDFFQSKKVYANVFVRQLVTSRAVSFFVELSVWSTQFLRSVGQVSWPGQLVSSVGQVVSLPFSLTESKSEAVLRKDSKLFVSSESLGEKSASSKNSGVSIDRSKKQTINWSINYFCKPKIIQLIAGKGYLLGYYHY